MHWATHSSSSTWWVARMSSGASGSSYGASVVKCTRQMHWYKALVECTSFVGSTRSASNDTVSSVCLESLVCV